MNYQMNVSCIQSITIHSSDSRQVEADYIVIVVIHYIQLCFKYEGSSTGRRLLNQLKIIFRHVKLLYFQKINSLVKRIETEIYFF